MTFQLRVPEAKSRRLCDATKMLTRGAVVLRPIYASEHATLDGTCVSVYPASEYDDGDLPNVWREQIPPVDEGSSSGDGTSPVGSFDKHANSV